LPVAHDAAAASVSRNASAGVAADLPIPTITSPTAPSRTPTSCGLVGRSRSAALANRTESTTCAWSTSEARPGGIPSASAV
jgi:hypothetical protein